MGKKLVFFDIDGTLWDYYNVIPESTIKAIHTLRENGHLVFLNTGRSRAYIYNPKLLDIGFDGIVSGCGTMIEYHGKVIFCREMEKEVVEHTMKILRKYKFRPILEGKDYLYMDREDFEDDFYGNKVMSEMGERLRGVTAEWGNWEICKLSCATEGIETKQCFAELEEYFDYMIHNSAVVEMVPKGFNKGTGIEKVCELLGMDIEDTFAFGDSVNDREMLLTAGTGVVMGNGTDEVKKIADYVTTELMDDGVWNACTHFNLI